MSVPSVAGVTDHWGSEISRALLEEVGKALRISPEERQVMLRSGNQTLFGNRLNWARSYVSKAGLIERPRRGYCRATDRGRQWLAESLSEIDLSLLERFPEFVAWRNQGKVAEAVDEPGMRYGLRLIASSF
jgi:restriction system protein